ncbi:hypothetical protein GCM10007105_08570 [Shewanella chilikensis]|nr:hypothetical protein GCM10007105_08570 [Shewanella chilikensis]
MCRFGDLRRIRRSGKAWKFKFLSSVERIDGVNKYNPIDFKGLTFVTWIQNSRLIKSAVLSNYSKFVSEK